MKLRVNKNVLIRDWLTIDYTIFGKPVTKKTFNEDFVYEWNKYKHDLLKRFYTINEHKLPKTSLDPVAEASALAKKVKQHLISNSKEQTKLQENINLVKENIYAHKPARDARNLAVRLVLAKEALCNIVGEENIHIYNMVKLLARATK